MDLEAKIEMQCGGVFAAAAATAGVQMHPSLPGACVLTTGVGGCCLGRPTPAGSTGTLLPLRVRGNRVYCVLEQ